MASPKDKRRRSGRRADRSARPVTLKAVADSIGLSPATVSVVLNRSPVADSIPRQTQERVFAAARKLNYRPNYLARSLRRQRSSSIGVLVPEISEGYAAAVLSGIEGLLLQEGYFYMVASHRSQADLLDESLERLRDRLVEGVILIAGPLAEAPGIPAVAVSGHRRLEGVTNVIVDHDRAAALALGHLADLGHERIAFFKGHEYSADTEARWRGILAAAAELGLAVRPELAPQLTGHLAGEIFSAEEAFQEGRVFGDKLLASGSEFTALFAFNDFSALGALRAFRDAGLRVPEDVSVVGFDDIVSAAFSDPGLTTVRQPLKEMGEIAARALLRRLAGADGASEVVTVEPELKIRASTGPPPARRRGAAG